MRQKACPRERGKAGYTGSRLFAAAPPAAPAAYGAGFRPLGIQASCSAAARNRTASETSPTFPESARRVRCRPAAQHNHPDQDLSLRATLVFELGESAGYAAFISALKTVGGTPLRKGGRGLLGESVLFEERPYRDRSFVCTRDRRGYRRRARAAGSSERRTAPRALRPLLRRVPQREGFGSDRASQFVTRCVKTR